MTSMARGSTPNLQHSASHFCGGVLLCWCRKAVISTAPQNCGFKTENNWCLFSSMIFFPWELSRACRLLLKLHQKQRSQCCTITSSLEKSQHVGHLFFYPLCCDFFFFLFVCFFLFISLLFYTLYFYELGFQQHLNCFFFSTLYKN